MQAAIAKQDRYKDGQAMMGVFVLLELIDEVCHVGKKQHYFIQKIEAQRNLLCFRQKDELTMAEYLKQFNLLVQIAKIYHVNFAEEGNIDHIINNTTLSNDMT